MPDTLVLLHGFGGTRRTWQAVIAAMPQSRDRVVALDLPGHGQAADAPPPVSVSLADCVEHVLAHSPARFALCGYSMGGRIALLLALAAPGRVQRLVLVSTSPGIEGAAERSQRRLADGRLADELASEPFEAFIERWSSQPLFAADPPEVTALACADQRRNNPRALAAALRGIGAGAMEPLWDRLGELAMPVTVIAGERDARYRALGARMVERLGDGELVVLPGGHRLPLESPGALAEVLAAR